MRTALLAFVAAILALAGLARPDDVTVGAKPPDEVTLDDCIQALRQWRESFASIEIVWHEWNRAQIEARFPELVGQELDGNYYRRYRFIWTDTGYMLLSYERYEDGIVVRRSQRAFDGDVHHTATSVTGKPSEWKDVTLHAAHESGRSRSSVIVNPLHGLWDNSSGRWLDESLASPQDHESHEWVGFVEVEGHPCQRLVIHTGPSSTSIDFDPNAGLLPRRVETIASMGDGSPTSRWTWTVTAFGDAEGTIYPGRGFLLTDERESPGYEWIVKELAINRTYPQSLFAPPTPSPNTVVSDLSRNLVTSPQRSAASARNDNTRVVMIADPARTSREVGMHFRILFWLGLIVATSAGTYWWVISHRHASPD